MLESEGEMTFDEWYATQKHQLSNEQVCRVIWEAAAREEREACAKAAEGFTETRDDRRWVPGSLYDTLRRETAAFIRMRSNAK